MPAPRRRPRKPAGRPTAAPPARLTLDSDEIAESVPDAWRRYIEEYLSNGYVKTRAKKAAGLTPTAPVPPYVREIITRRLAAQFNRLRVTGDRVVHELATIAFANIEDYRDGEGRIDVDSLPPEVTAAIKELRVKVLEDGTKEVIDVKLHDKMSALAKLGDMLRLFPQHHEHTGAGGGPIQVDVDVRAAAKRITERVRTLVPNAEGEYVESD